MWRWGSKAGSAHASVNGTLVVRCIGMVMGARDPRAARAGLPVGVAPCATGTVAGCCQTLIIADLQPASREPL